MTENARRLERRYRWLLLAYPRAYRQATEQELLWVLMASATEGQRWPTLADTADLLSCGVLERFRTWRQPGGRPCWRDGLALFSVAAPVVMLIAATIQVAWWHTANVAQLLDVAIAAAVLLGSRRVALAVTALAMFCAILPGSLLFFGLRPHWISLPLIAGRFIAMLGSYQAWFWLLEVIALICSAGPRRGRQLLTWPGVVSVAVLGVLLSELWFGAGVAINLACLAALLAALAVLARSSRPGRWAAALLALMLYPYMLLFVPVMYWLDSPAMLALRYLVPVCIGGLIMATILRARAQPGATGQAGSAGPPAGAGD